MSLLTDNPARAVLRVAWPVVVLGLAQAAYFLTDAWFIGQLGESQLTAMGAAWFAVMALVQLAELPATGLHSLVARAIGARSSVDTLLTQGLWLGAGLGLLVAASYPLAGYYFRWLDIHPGTDTFQHGLDYLGAGLLGGGAMILNAVVSGAFRGLGQTATAMVVTFATVALNLVLDPLFIWGAGPFPALGIAGAAWATVVAHGFGALIGLLILWRRGHRPAVVAPQLAGLAHITRIGAPIAIAGVTFAAISLVLGRFIAQCGQQHLAGIGLGLRFEVVPFVIATGLQAGVATVVGQQLGARSADTAWWAVTAGSSYAWLLLAPLGVVMFVVAEPISLAVADSEEVGAAAALYLQFVAVVTVFRGLEAIYTGALTGIGETRPALLISGGAALARIPLAWLLAFPLGMGIEGIWTVIAATTFLKGILMSTAFRVVRRRHISR